MIGFIIEADLFSCDLRAEAEERIEHQAASSVDCKCRYETGELNRRTAIHCVTFIDKCSYFLSPLVLVCKVRSVFCRL